MSGTVVAVKVAPLPGPNVQTNDKGLRALEHECRVYDRLYGSTEHPHVLRVTGVCRNLAQELAWGRLGLLLPLVPKGHFVPPHSRCDKGTVVCVCVAFVYVTISSQHCLQ